MGTLIFFIPWLVLSAAAGEAEFKRDADYLLKLAPELFPKQIEQTDFELGKVIRFYEPDNLYEYINGRASLYLSYSFLRLAHGVYLAEGREDKILLDIYDMGRLPSGFGIYAAERNPDLAFRPLGTQGYSQDGSVNFFKNRFYVKLEAEGEADDLIDAVGRLASEVAGRLPGEVSWPRELSFLPDVKKLANTEEYLPSALLGYKFLGDGYSARYGLAGLDEPARLFFTAKMEPQKARHTFQELRDAWGGDKMERTDFLSGPEVVLTGEAPYLGEAVIFLVDGRVCGLVGPGANGAGRDIVKSLLDSFSR